jgi:S-adenosyl-L-homocysteine hydrolase.
VRLEVCPDQVDDDQADYLGLNVAGPFKPEQYRY